MSSASPVPLRLAVLISGNGSNLQAFIDAIARGALDARIALVVSNREDACGLERAARAGLPRQVLPGRGFDSREAYDAALAEVVRAAEPGLVVLAGFMRILSGDFVRAFRGRMLNIHPALLPRYRGLHTHRRVLAAGDAVHGTSVHFVTEQLDAGPVIAQARLPVQPGDDEARLSARVQRAEHKLYPRVVGWFAGGRLAFRDDQAWLDGEQLTTPVVYEFEQLIEDDEGC